jgi:predicted ATP-dependent endonuclease of OLD family
VFDHNCLILVGKNEAGKSNILKAIAAVFGQYKVSDKDKRKRIDNEKIKGYYVRAIIKLDENDFSELLKRLRGKYTNMECIVFKSNKTLRGYIKAIFHEFLVQIDIADNKNINYLYWSYTKNDFDLKDDIYLNGVAFNTTKTGTKPSISLLIFEELKKMYNEKLYICHYWKYDKEKHLLPNSINIETFKASPSSCLSLQNIFLLSNIENIKDEFVKAHAEDGDYENLLERVSKKVTSEFQKIWQDFKETSIQLRHNGTEISIKIVDKAKYICEERSDGFKKFISFLLMLSTQARANKIGERDIILIDEPDQSLYPTSARYLRDELLKISEKTKVIFSTHSPYMIDANCIDRHLIVEKKEDVTTAKKQAKNASYSNDELLRQAIGASIFDSLHNKNIIFEGWLDKELFEKYRMFNKIDGFEKIGVVYLQGISGVETLVQMLILASKRFIIISDSDKPSNDKRKEFENAYMEFSQNWLSYADVVKNVSTMEDFLATAYISEHLKKENPKFIYDASKSAIGNIEIIANKDKERRQKIKNELVNRIDKKDINKDYGDFINKLKEKLSKL